MNGSHPEGDGEAVWAIDPQHTDPLDPNFYTHGLYTKRVINTLSSLADVQKTSPMTLPSPMSITQANKTMSSQKHLIMTNTDLNLVG